MTERMTTDDICDVGGVLLWSFHTNKLAVE